jgi:hypothetical protein
LVVLCLPPWASFASLYNFFTPFGANSGIHPWLFILSRRNHNQQACRWHDTSLSDITRYRRCFKLNLFRALKTVLGETGIRPTLIQYFYRAFRREDPSSRFLFPSMHARYAEASMGEYALCALFFGGGGGA